MRRVAASNTHGCRCSALQLQSCVLTSESVAGGLPILLLLISRLPQIYQNARQGHTGMLATPTYALNTLGSLARVFTILQETAVFLTIDPSVYPSLHLSI